jgi:hypothetical protein
MEEPQHQDLPGLGSLFPQRLSCKSWKLAATSREHGRGDPCTLLGRVSGEDLGGPWDPSIYKGPDYGFIQLANKHLLSTDTVLCPILASVDIG